MPGDLSPNKIPASNQDNSNQNNKGSQIILSYKNQIDEDNTHFNGYVAQISRNVDVSEVTFECSRIDDSRLIAISDALNKNKYIQKLNLSFNLFKSQGFTALCETLKTNTTLKSLILSYNELDLNSINNLANLLRENTSLQNVSLEHCSINDKGIQLLSEALKERRHRLTLDLSNNKIGKPSSHELYLLIKQNPFVIVKLDDNPGIRDKAKTTIANLVKENKARINNEISNSKRYALFMIHNKNGDEKQGKNQPGKMSYSGLPKAIKSQIALEYLSENNHLTQEDANTIVKSIESKHFKSQGRTQEDTNEVKKPSEDIFFKL